LNSWDIAPYLTGPSSRRVDIFISLVCWCAAPMIIAGVAAPTRALGSCGRLAAATRARRTRAAGWDDRGSFTRRFVVGLARELWASVVSAAESASPVGDGSARSLRSVAGGTARGALRGLSKLLGSASKKIAILSGSRGCVWWAGLWCKSLLCLWTLGSPLGLLGAEVFWSS
jgi:hypothetical protein